MGNPTQTKNYTAGAAVTKYRLVKFGATDGAVLTGAAATDLLIGVNEALDVASGDRADVIRAGIAEVEYGGAVTRGAKLTSDASGKAVAAAPAADANVHVIGIAEVSGVDGDIGSVFISPSVMQG
jgi:hypothetical protein